MDILLELKEKGNIWVDIESKQLKAWYKGREYGVPVSVGLTDWENC
jgi:maltose-binding protein MalE